MSAHLHGKVLNVLELAIHALEDAVPAPVISRVQGDVAYRYQEKSIEQALVQKAARIVSTLNAARILSEYGFVQEQAALQRILDELDEDIWFLSFGIINSEVTELHRKYLSAFYEEEFDKDSAMESSQKRPQLPREKIRAYLSRTLIGSDNPSRAVEVARTLHKTYSGYVHAASPHLMEMYLGTPPRFRVRGIRGTPLHLSHQEDLNNYFYRTAMAVSVVAKALAQQELFDALYLLSKEVEASLN